MNDIFTDVANDDYTLNETAPVVNAGNNSLFTAVTSVLVDMAGNPRLSESIIDLGAYEYQSTASINGILENELIKVYPNPAHSVVMIDAPESMEIQVVSVLGEVVLSQKLNPGSNSVSVEHLTSGVYVIKTNLGESLKFIRK